MQDEQVEANVAPVLREKVPAAQESQLVAPAAAWWLPAPHEVHTLAPATE